MYKIIHAGMVQRLSDGAFIPTTPDNHDYRAYLAWTEKGNVPTPADAIPPPDVRRADALQAMQDVIDDVGIPPKLRAMAQALKAAL